MRGKGASWKCLIDCKGITPAYAGKSEIFELSHNLKKDHPRLCGEKMRTANGMHGDLGSPPPMRGKVVLFCTDFKCIRITPAYAGKSLNEMNLAGGDWDHPRLCGEKASL